MLDDLGLVHMNGRIYDPLLGRFQSADAVVQFPGNLQSYNRYSYVQNNPLTLVDPTGHVIAIPVPLVLLGEGLTATGSTMIAAPAGIVLLAAWLGQNVPVKDPFAPLVEGIHRNAVAKLDRNAVAPAKTGDQGRIASGQSNDMSATQDKPATSTASPAPHVSTPQEGLTTAASDAAQEGVTAANPSDTSTTTASPAPAVDIPLKMDAAERVVAKANPFELAPTHALTKSKRAFGELKADIAQNGVKDPIKYVEHNGQKYIVDGHHRARAAKELGIKEVPVEQVQLPFGGYKSVDDLFNP